MADRKDFLKKLATGVLLGAAAPWKNLMAQSFTAAQTDTSTWESIRKQFVIPPRQAYLNTATLGLMPDAVVNAIGESLQKRVRQGRYWLAPNPLEDIARLVHADKDEIAITQNTTQGINIIAQGLHLKEGDEVIISNQEHVGNALPWLNRSRRDKIKLKVFEPGDTAAETLDRIDRLISIRTQVIAIPHITCTTGHLLPIKEIVDLAHSRSILVFVDGAHGPGTLDLNMHDLGCDFYAGCGHKWLCGPAGTGFLYIARDRLYEVDTVMAGAYSDTGWKLDRRHQKIDGMRQEADRFDYGTRPTHQYAGLSAAVRFIEGIGMERIMERHRYLHQYLREQIEVYPEIKILTPSESRSHGAILSFKTRGIGMDDAYHFLGERKIKVRKVPESGLNAIRISPHLYTTTEDLDRTVAAIREMIHR